MVFFRLFQFLFLLAFITMVLESIGATEEQASSFKLEVRYPTIHSKDYIDLLKEWSKRDEYPWIVESYTASGQPVLCEMPLIEFSETSKLPTQAEVSTPVSRFLLPLKSSCMSYIEGWWTYEFCFAKHVRQFHVSPQGKLEAEYVLGKATLEEYHPNSWLNFDKSSDNEETDDYVLNVLEKVHSQSTSLSNTYYSEKYTHGTTCDVHHGSRNIEIRWHCSPSASASFIRSIKEPASCQYLMDIDSPLLCQHPLYSTETQLFHQMNCHIINDDDDGEEDEPEPNVEESANVNDEHHEDFLELVPNMIESSTQSVLYIEDDDNLLDSHEP